MTEMKISRATPLTVGITLIATLWLGCSFNPIVRRDKFFASGQRYYQKGQYREALIQFQNSLQSDPKFVDGHYQVAQCYIKLGNGQEAYLELRRVIDLNPNYVKAHIDLGNLYLLGGADARKAQDEADKALAIDPNNAEAHALMANSIARQGNPFDAEKEMERAVQLAPGKPDAYMNLAVLQENAKQFPAAEDSFKKAISMDPKSARPVMALAIFYADQQRFNEAEQQIQHAIELAPKDPEPRLMLGRLYQGEQKFDQAEEVYKQGKQALADDPEGYTMLGDYYADTRQIDKGIAEFASLLGQHPKAIRLKKKYAALLLMGNRLDDASNVADEILKENPKDTNGLLIKAQVMARQDNSAGAAPLVQSVLKAQPDDAVAHYLLGTIYSQTGNTEQADAEWHRAAQLKPEFWEVQEALANLALQKHDPLQLQQAADALIKILPISPEGYIYRGMAKATRNDLAGADADLSKAIQLAPKSPIPYTRMAELRMNERKFSDAEKLFEQALTLNPNAVDALNGLASLFAVQKQPKKGIDRVQAQVAKTPNNPAVYMLLGQLEWNEKELDQAEAAFQKASELDKKDTNSLMTLGRVQVARGSDDKAIATYQAALQRDPRDVRIYFLLGGIEQRHGNWQGAEDLYQKALAVQPDYPLAANDLAFLMLEHGGNTDVALHYAQVARRAFPDFPNTADTLAWADYKKGVYSSAIELLQVALNQQPQNATYHYHLGLAYAKTRNVAQAREHLQRALQLNPKIPQANEIKKTLGELAKG